MTIKTPDYGAIKDKARTEHFPVTEGTIYGPRDVQPTAEFLLGELYKEGKPIDGDTMAKTQFGFAYGEYLPNSIVSDTTPEGVYENVSIPPDAKADDGFMLIGEGNPPTGFVVNNKDFVQLGVSVRYTKDDQIPASDANGTFRLPASRNGNGWRVAFAVTALNGVKLADLQDVSLTLTLATGSMMDADAGPKLVLNYDAATNEWVADGFKITDSATNEVSVQNIQGYEFPFIRERLEPAIEEGQIPYGSFVVTLKASYQGKDALLFVPITILKD